jgi:S-adenosyl methyltransferase
MAAEIPPPGVDVSVPSPARVYDYMLGGKDNFAVDREASDVVIRQAPAIADLAPANRDFLRRAVGFLAAECGVRQFLDIGAGLPTQNNVHQLARRHTPDFRVVYVDNDPVVRVHANALLTNDPGARFVEADLRAPQSIVGDPEVRGFLDFSQPIGLLLVAVLHFLRESDDPAGVVGRLVEALPAGSYLVISHVTTEEVPRLLRDLIEETYRGKPSPVILRPRDRIAELFGGLPLVDPGLVTIEDWRPDVQRSPGPLRILGGVARA